MQLDANNQSHSNGSCNIEAGGGAWQKSDMGDDLNLGHAISTGIDS